MLCMKNTTVGNGLLNTYLIIFQTDISISLDKIKNDRHCHFDKIYQERQTCTFK